MSAGGLVASPTRPPALVFYAIILPLPPTPATTSRPPCYSHLPLQTTQVSVLVSGAVTLCAASARSARDVPRATLSVRSTRETPAGAYSADTPAGRSCETPLELTHQPTPPV